MHGQRIGYVRVSSFDQNPERQLEHVQVDRLFTDKASGKDTQRPELERLLAANHRRRPLAQTAGGIARASVQRWRSIPANVTAHAPRAT